MSHMEGGKSVDERERMGAIEQDVRALRQEVQNIKADFSTEKVMTKMEFEYLSSELKEIKVAQQMQLEKQDKQNEANRENFNKFLWLVGGVVITQVVLFFLRGGLNAP